MIPEGFITSLLDRADIVDVIGRYVPLKKAGRNMQACCPFHKEKTPSFSVSPTKQFYKCFGCGVSGNAIGFVMAYEGLDFPEAVRKVAGFYGMTVPEDTSPARARQREKSRTLTDYMAEAAGFYTEKLRTAPRVIDYLKARAIHSDTAERFGLGYSPDEWHSLKDLFGPRYEDKALEECGLVNVKNDRRYDAFRGRLMFPIRNPKGQVIGFGARTLNGDEQPKYLNSPETPIYHKGSELYGLYEGREAIHQKGRAIVCEGYMDVIQLSQAGFTESVAALGTSITTEHVHKLFKLADTVYFSFDGDTAGRKAARRALEATLPVITDVQKAGFIILPPEHDPDSLIKAEGPQAYEAEIDKAYTLTGFVKHLLLEGKELMYAEERAKIVAEAKPLVMAMQNAPILRLTLIKEIAGIARLTSDEIQRQYGLMTAAPRPSVASGYDRGSRFGNHRRAPLERRVRVKDIRERMIQLFLAYPSLLSTWSHQIEEEFLEADHPLSQEIVALWRASVDEDGHPVRSAAALLQGLGASDSLDYYQSLLAEEIDVDTPFESADLEMKRAFVEIELERVKGRIEMEARSGVTDAEILRPLIERREELRQLIVRLSAEERNYRQRLDLQKRWEKDREFQETQRGGGDSPLALSDHPIVRKLQEHLRGQDGIKSATTQVEAVQALVDGEAHPAPIKGPTAAPSTSPKRASGSQGWGAGAPKQGFVRPPETVPSADETPASETTASTTNAVGGAVAALAAVNALQAQRIPQQSAPAEDWELALSEANEAASEGAWETIDAVSGAHWAPDDTSAMMPSDITVDADDDEQAYQFENEFLDDPSE